MNWFGRNELAPEDLGTLVTMQQLPPSQIYSYPEIAISNILDYVM